MKNKIDAVKLIRKIRDENYERTKKMPRVEEFEAVKKRSAEARKKFLVDSKTVEA